jgi:peptide/nickel transport system permease protein
MLSRIARHLVAVCATVLMGTLVTATMVRFAPGFDVDVRQLDSRLTHESVAALRAQRMENGNILRFYAKYLTGAAHGDFGKSLMLDRPVRDLLIERIPTTMRLAGGGLVEGWLIAAVFAFSAALFRNSGYDLLTATMGGAFLCVPTAVLALAFVLWQAPASLAIACVIFPKVFRYVHNILAHNCELPHVITARAKGLGAVRVLLWHVLPVSAAPLIALAGVSVSLALGAAVPVEALCGIPGIGQLAWQAALARDLPLLLPVTMFVTVVILAANLASDLLTGISVRSA